MIEESPRDLVQYLEVEPDGYIARRLGRDQVAGYYASASLDDEIYELEAFVTGFAYTRVFEESADEYWAKIEMPKLGHINVYLVSRHYGGPEEGGWWFTVYEPKFSSPVTGKNALAEKERIESMFENKESDHYDPSYRVVFELHEPVLEPKHRPLYC